MYQHPIHCPQVSRCTSILFCSIPLYSTIHPYPECIWDRQSKSSLFVFGSYHGKQHFTPHKPVCSGWWRGRQRGTPWHQNDWLPTPPFGGGWGGRCKAPPRIWAKTRALHQNGAQGQSFEQVLYRKNEHVRCEIWHGTCEFSKHLCIKEALLQYS